MSFLIKHISILVLPFIFIVGVSAQTTRTALRPKIERLINKLRKEKEVHFGNPVGYTGRRETKNKYYKLYVELKHKATVEELVLLTADSSTCIEVYAFNILWLRQYPDLKNIFLQHQNDTTYFWTAGGCTGMLDRVNWFMFRPMRPMQGAGTKDYLTIKEYETFCSKFKKADPHFTCN